VVAYGTYVFIFRTSKALPETVKDPTMILITWKLVLNFETFKEGFQFSPHWKS